MTCMGTINDGLVDIEARLCQALSAPTLRTDASLTERLLYIKQLSGSLISNGSAPYRICIEGPDKTGKTTQCQLLVQAMTESGLPTEGLNEFSDSRIGSLIRPVLMDRDDIPAHTALALFTAVRADLYLGRLFEVWQEGKHIVLDRGMLSTFAYACEGLNLAEEYVAHWTTDIFYKPDLTVLFTGDPVAPAEPERFEKLPHDLVAGAFLKHADKFDAVAFYSGGSVREVHQRLVELVAVELQLEINPVRQGDEQVPGSD